MANENKELNKDSSSIITRCLIVIFLFCAWPLINFVYNNRQQLDANGLIFILFTLLLTLIFAYLAFYLLYRLNHRLKPIGATVPVVCFVLLFFNYYLVFDGLIYFFSFINVNFSENLAFALIVAVICISSFYYLNKRPILDLLLIFGVIVTAMPVIGSAYFFTTMTMANGKSEMLAASLNESNKPLLSTPDIFHIILDAYSRDDLLIKMTNWKNTEFIESLEQLGFYVANKSYSNYPMTFVSIASTFEMNYLVTENTTPYKSRSSFYRSIRGENPVVSYLKRHHYRFAYLGSGTWDGTKCIGMEDLCLSSNNAVEQSILYLTPLRRFFISRRTTVLDIKSQLDEILDASVPTYTFAHLLSPHPPRNYNANCRQILVKGAGSISDFWGDQDGYVNDIKCLNRQLLDLINAILDRAPDSVIILHGDHGTAFSIDWSLPIEKWPASQVEERFAIFMGLRLPEQCSATNYNSISPVNIYRLLFACLQGNKLELLPDKSYVTPKENHSQFGLAFPYQTQVQ